MKKENAVLLFCLILQLIAIVYLCFFDYSQLFGESYTLLHESKGLCLILNLIIITLGLSIFLNPKNDLTTKRTIWAMIIAVVAIGFFGVYSNAYFFANMVLFVVAYDVVKEKISLPK